jgi:hypothetical protein
MKAFLKRTAIAAAARSNPMAAIYAATHCVSAANAMAYFQGAGLADAAASQGDGPDALLLLLLALLGL